MSEKEKPVAHRELLEGIVTGMAEAPDREADPHTKVEVKEAVAKGLERFADHELYDIVQRLGNREPHCEVSPFVHTLSNLDQFYLRPAPPLASEVPK